MQLRADVTFLAEELHVMDYSLLIGVRRGRFIVNPDDDGAAPDEPASSVAAPLTQPPSTELRGPAADVPAYSAVGAGASIQRPSFSLDRSPFVGTASPIPRLSLGSTSNLAQMAAASEAALQRHTLDGADAAPSKVSQTVLPLHPRPTPSTGSIAGGATAPSGIELASIVEGPQSYHIGLIDVLQRWTVTKRLERYVKIWLKCANGEGISAVPPAEYAKRFTDRVISDVFDSPDVHLDEEPQAQARGGGDSRRSV